MNLGNCLVGSLVLVAASALTACGGDQSKPASSSGSSAASSSVASSSSSSASSTTQAASAGYDITRIGGAKTTLPAGFSADDIPADTVNQEQMDAAGIGGLGTGATTTVTPAECAVVLKPFAPVGVGAKAHGFMATSGPNMIIVMAAQSDKPIGAITQSGCDHFSAKSASGMTASVDSVPGPEISGVKTAGHTAHVTSEGKTIDETTFTAALDDKTIVVVQGDSPAATMSDVLAKAVAAVKG